MIDNDGGIDDCEKEFVRCVPVLDLYITSMNRWVTKKSNKTNKKVSKKEMITEK